MESTINICLDNSSLGLNYKLCKSRNVLACEFGHVMPQLVKTVRIETYTSRFGGTFFLQLDRPCFFSEPRGEKQKTKICHTEPGQYDGRQRLWLFLLPVGRRPFQSMVRVDRVVSDAAYERLH